MEKLDYTSGCKDVETARRIIQQFKSNDFGRHEGKEEHEIERGLHYVNGSYWPERIRQSRERRIDGLRYKPFYACLVNDHTRDVDGKLPRAEGELSHYMPTSEHFYTEPDNEVPMISYWTFRSVRIQHPIANYSVLVWKRIS